MIKHKGVELNTRFTVSKNDKTLTLLTTTKLSEDQEPCKVQGFDVTGKHHTFKFSLKISRSDLEEIIKKFRAVLKDHKFAINLENKFLKNLKTIEDRDYRAHNDLNPYKGFDISKILTKSLVNLDKVSIFTKDKGYCKLRMTEEFAKKMNLDTYDYKIRGAAISLNLDKSKKSVRFMYELELSPIAASYLAKKLWKLNQALASRMLDFAGDWRNFNIRIDPKGEEFKMDDQFIVGVRI